MPSWRLPPWGPRGNAQPKPHPSGPLSQNGYGHYHHGDYDTDDPDDENWEAHMMRAMMTVAGGGDDGDGPVDDGDWPR